MMLCALDNFKMDAVQSTVSSMYRLPALYNDSTPLELPSCMYRMSSHHYQEVSNGNEQLGDILSLENKQESILKELRVLKYDITDLSLRLHSLGLDVKLPTKKSQVSVDYVISASPKDPPLSLFFLQQIMNQRNMVHSTSAFVHSSACDSDVNQLPRFQKARNDQGRGSPCLLTVVWKNVPDLPFLVISSSHTPLVGEFTIARHICRTLLPDLYIRFCDEEIAHLDHWIDFANNLIIKGKNKERANALGILDTHLGSTAWLVGSQMSVADIAVASAVMRGGQLQSTFVNVKEWLKNFPSLQ